jgi:hypothetical protein
MALTRLNNRSISAVTALPNSITDYALTTSDLPAQSVIKTDSYLINSTSPNIQSDSYVSVGTYTYTPAASGSKIIITHRYRCWWGITTDGGSNDVHTRYLIGSTVVHENPRMFGNVSYDKRYTHHNMTETFQITSTSTSQITIDFQAQVPVNMSSVMNFYHAHGDGGQSIAMYFVEYKQ